MGFEYRAPGTMVQERPKCWGQEQFMDPNSRECRNCGSRNSCQDQIVRIKNTAAYQHAQVQQQTMAYGPYPPPQVQQQPVQIPVQQPQPQPVYVQPTWRPAAPVPQVVPAFTPATAVPAYPQQMAQRPMSPHPVPAGYGYGWLPDPLFYQMAANPPPMRPQFGGESFAVRLGKNMLLATGEALLMQLLLGMRQLVLAPRQPAQMPQDYVAMHQPR